MPHRSGVGLIPDKPSWHINLGRLISRPPLVMILRSGAPQSSASRVSTTNQILKAFPEETRRRLHANLELVRLPARKILCEPGDLLRFAFFPERAVLSLLGLTGDGD